MKIFFVFICEIIFTVHCQDISVQTANAGNIKGKVHTVNDKSYGVYLGIPYAKPPIDNLRFKEPQPLETTSSETTFDASNGFSKMCVQAFGYFANNQSEDCLYLNVMTPKNYVSENTKYPVMVWIHGGGFLMGSASAYPVEGTLRNIVSRGVIFVSINYRLGTIGFLTTKSSVAPGNYGLLDQLESLRWIKNNIHFFGGDPDKVTLFGESSGGASVSLLTISPLAKGLFNQAIIMSGSALYPWLLMYDGEPNDVSGMVMESLGCRNQTTRHIEAACPYRSRPAVVSTAEMLQQHETEMACLRSKSITDIALQFGPTFEMKPRIDGYFLPESPDVLVKKRISYNLMIGANAGETGSYQFFEFPGIPPAVVQTEDEFKRSSSSAKFCNVFKFPELVSFTSLYHYAHSSTPIRSSLNESHFWFQQSIKLQTAPMFWIPAYRDASEAASANSKVYLYSWDYQDAVDFFHQKANFYWKGAAHASELFSIFDSNAVDVLIRDGPHTRRDKSQDKKSAEVWGKLLTNFAKFGNPTPDASIDNVTWQPFTIKDSNYLSIDMPKIRMAKKFYEDDVELWTRFIPALEESVECK